MNRSKDFQIMKIEKENENKDIKTKQKVLLSKAGFGGPGSLGGFFERNQDQILGKQALKFNSAGNKGRSSQESSIGNFNAMDPFRESTDQYVKSLGIFPNHKPLSPYMAPTPGPKPRLGQKQIKRQSKVITMPELNQKIFHDNKCIDLQSSNRSQKDSSITEELKPSASGELSIGDVSNKSNSIVAPPNTDSTANGLKEAVSKSESDNISFLSSINEPSATVPRSDSCTYLDLDLCSLGSANHGSDIYHTAPLLPIPKSLNSTCTACKSGDVTSRQSRRDDTKLEKNINKKTDKDHLTPKAVTKTTNTKFIKSALETELEEMVKSQRTPRSAHKNVNTLAKERLKYSHKKMEIATPKSPKRVSAFCQTTDNSLTDRKRRSPITKVNDFPAFSDDTDLDSVRPNYHKRYEYFQRESARVSPKKRAAHSPGKRKNESLVKKSMTNKDLTARSTLIEYPSQIEMKLHVSDISESDEKLKRASYKRSAHKQQVDVTFRNVKSLKKEILILRALGDRLEATLERTASEPSLSPGKKRHGLSSSNSIESLTRELEKIDSSISIFPGRRSVGRARCHARAVKVIIQCRQRVSYLSYAKGLLHESGIVQEFAIVPKTIDELRRDPSSSFYISKNGRWECTSFEKLKSEPKILLQNLKSKNSGQHFNLLDHDPIFFNSLLIPTLGGGVSEKTQSELRSRPNKPPGNRARSLQQVSNEIRGIFKSDPSNVRSNTVRPAARKENIAQEIFKEVLPIEEDEEEVQPTAAVVQKKSKELPKSVETKRKETTGALTPVTARRGRIRRNLTPMPVDAFDDPKYCLWKKCLIGFTQVSIFLCLIMALSLPDIKC